MSENRPEEQNKKHLIRSISDPLFDILCTVIYQPPQLILVRFFDPETFPIYEASYDFEKFLLDGCFSKIKEWREITLSYEYYGNSDEIETIVVEGDVEIEDVDLIYKQVGQLISKKRANLGKIIIPKNHRP